MDRRLARFLRTKLRAAGREFETARRAYRDGLADAEGSPSADADGGGVVPVDVDGRARIVCRRYAERRAVELDPRGRPDCFDREHPDCRGCAEDVREGVVEIW